MPESEHFSLKWGIGELAQRKIPVLFNCGHKIASISDRHLVKPASGQKNGLFYGHCQLRCPALLKDLSQSEDKERYIPDTSELRSERLYFRIE